MNLNYYFNEKETALLYSPVLDELINCELRTYELAFFFTYNILELVIAFFLYQLTKILITTLFPSGFSIARL